MTNSSYLTVATSGVDENGFMYTKGKSRSKAFGSEAGERLPVQKRPKINREFRETRRQNITEDLKCTNTQIQFKEQRIETEATSKNFKICDVLSEEVTELKKKRQLLESELTLLIKKEKRSKLYYRRKEKQYSSGDSDVPLSDSDSLRSSSFPRSSRSTVSPSPPFSPPQTQTASYSFQKLNQNLVLHGISASLLLHACAIIAFLLENYCMGKTHIWNVPLFHSTGHIIVVNITSS